MTEIDTTNGQSEPETPPPEPPPALPFQRPSDYYTTPIGHRRRLFPRWVPFGCGAASLVFIAALFVMGGLVASGKLGGIFELVFGQLQTEMQGQFTKDVTPAQKAAFNAEMKALLDRLHENKVPPDRLQPMMKVVRQVSGDEKIDGREVERVIAAIREVNSPRK